MDRRRFLLTWLTRVMALVAAAVLVGCGGVNPSSSWQAHCSQGNYAPQSLDEWFQASFEVVPGRRGSQVEGYIYNHFSAGVERMLVGVEQLNPSGQAMGCSMVWISGTVPPEDRAYFVAAVPDASAKYRVRVLSFNWMKRTERDRPSGPRPDDPAVAAGAGGSGDRLMDRRPAAWPAIVHTPAEGELSDGAPAHAVSIGALDA